jgi:hypothetical protein
LNVERFMEQMAHRITAVALPHEASKARFPTICLGPGSGTPGGSQPPVA